MQKYLCLFLSAWMFLACRGREPNEAHALQQNLLARYAYPADSLRYKAAVFLLSNIGHHCGYYGSEVEKYKRIFSAIDSVRFFKPNLTDADKMHIADSIVHYQEVPDADKIAMISDQAYVTAEYLAANIETALVAWQQSPWHAQVSFPDFCEYILPYRIRDEQVEHWRPAFYREYKKVAGQAPQPDNLRSVYDHLNARLNTETNFNIDFNNYYPFPQSLGNIVKGHIGGCETTSYFAIMAMRAVGLPVALDYIPHWGNTNSRHYMPRLIDHQPTTRINNENELKDTWGLVDFSSGFIDYRHHFTRKDLPRSLYVDYIKTIPKVYRYTFSSSGLLRDINRTVDARFISTEFQNANLVDVTDEYLICSRALLKVGSALARYPVLHLCVFDISGWQPVAVAKISGGVALFEKLGRRVVYMPMVYEDGEQRPAGDPFYLDSLDVIHYIKKDPHRTQDMSLVRKTSLFAYTAYHTETLHGGRFEGANKPDFSDATVLHTITGYPFYLNTATVHCARPFRYLRYVAPRRERDHWEADNIAEVQFLSGQGTDPLKGRFIGSPGTAGFEIEKAFDNDLNTCYADAAYKNGWIGIDLGEGHAEKIAAIRFCPRNDTNCVLPGNEYELFYWDGTWVSLGTQHAEDFTLVYEDVPVGALFWLRCLTEGREERIFTYEGRQQLWW